MGVRNLARIAEQLVAGGRPATEPVAVVERGTLPGQRTVSGTLADIAERVAAAGLKAPAITLVGPVALLRERLEWLERRPLFGRSVVVTRARAQASGLAARLSALGAQVVEAPAIRIEPRPAAEVDPVVERIGDYSLVCLTSPNGAALLFEAARCAAAVTPARWPARPSPPSGPGTAAELAPRRHPRRRGAAALDRRVARGGAARRGDRGQAPC